MHAVIRGALAVAMMVCAFLFVLRGVALPQDFPNCTEFGVQIPNACCCTNNCCGEAKEGEIVHFSGDEYRVVATGQILKRTGWSPDGRFIKCACDLIEGKWTVHPRAFVRCIYPPQPSS